MGGLEEYVEEEMRRRGTSITAVTGGSAIPRPPRFVEVAPDFVEDDLTSVITGMQTVDYQLYNSMYPSAADLLHMVGDDHDEEEEEPELVQGKGGSTGSRSDTTSTAGPNPASVNHANNHQGINLREEISLLKVIMEAQEGPKANLNSNSASSPNQGLPRGPTTNAIRYDNRGMVCKSTFRNATDHQVGAFAQAGPGFAEETPIHLVEEESDGNISDQDPPQTRAEHDDNKKLSIRWWHNRTYFSAAILGLLLVMAIAVAMPFVLRGGGDSSEGDLFLDRDRGTQEAKLEVLVPDLPDSTIQAIQDSLSVQAQAHKWIEQDPNWDTYEDWRKKQRFAMACIYFAFGTFDKSQNILWQKFLYEMSQNLHECDWDGAIQLCPENDGVVRSISDKGFKNGQHGYFPPEIALLSHLEILRFGSSLVRSFEEAIPCHNLTFIKELNLVGADLTGTIPSSLGRLTRLTHLELNNNFLTGTIPSEIARITNLRTLILSSNGITGIIPEELGDLSSLTTFQVGGNPEMEPSVPPGFCAVGRPSWGSLNTDWCGEQEACCEIP
jgi:Leucine rich repeat